MALKLHFPFPIFAPPPLPPLNPSPNPNTNPSHHRPATEVRFSRWNNANAAEFNEQRRAQKEIEDDIRRHRRFDSATRIAENHETDTPTNPPNNEGFKSLGTPSSPSSPSIPGKKSKYSKDPNSHPAFRKVIKTHKIPIKPPQRPVPPQANLTIRDDGISYVIEGAPFEFKYSYTETPKVKPIKLREPPFAPFGPTTTARPWTGRAPLPPSKKKLKEFDSFKLPPPHKKGVKPVQAPGPFLAGSGPRYTRSREEILGEPLTKEEIKDLVDGCLKSKRQLNMGRDGLTHNMLDNIHAHWKRRRVCKIKCKGVCTVDMDNVRQQLEERTGGKIIYGKGGVIFLFRGRNYNYRTRPRFPLMLWKPVTPVYPRLVKQVPEGLTIKEATEMRKKGRNLISICKLGKNGVYCELVNHVREAFGECELVRINCQGMNPSDYKKIGGKLKDLVPCVLISFESEHILMWRGRNWESSLPKLENDHEEAKKSNVGDATCVALPLEDTEMSASYVPTISVKDASRETLDTSMSPMGSMDVDVEGSEDLYSIQNVKPSVGTDAVSTVGKTNGSETISDITGRSDDEPEPKRNTCETVTMLDPIGVDDESEPMSYEYGNDAILDNTGCAQKGLEALTVDPITHDKLLDVSEEVQDLNPPPRLSTPCTEGVLLLQKQAVDNGSAVILDDSALDADIIYQRAVAVAKSAPPGPVFRHRFRKVAVKKPEEQETGDLKEEERTTVSPGDWKEEESTRVSAEKRSEKKKKTTKSVSIKKETVFDEIYNDVVPQGSLRVDELAKLLA